LPSAPPPNPYSLLPNPCLYACLYRPPAPDGSDGKNREDRGDRKEHDIFSAVSASSAVFSLVAVAQEFSPRYERHRDDLVSVDISGLTRLLGSAQAIGEEMRREAAARGVRAHVAIARTRMTALLLAQARPGLTVVAHGDEANILASLPLALLEKSEVRSPKYEDDEAARLRTSDFVLQTSTKWGVKTLGELAALPSADLMARLGRPARTWQAIARGEDIRPLVPMLEDERFEASLDLEWPIADLEPLSFVFTRLLEPLSTRLERRDRGAAVLHILLRLVTRDSTSIGRETSVRRLELPTPMREVRALRTLALLDLEAHPVEAAIDRVTIVIDPTPGRIVQHTLYTRAQPTPEQLSTLLARLGALMGQDRFGAPVSVDTERPGAFAMAPFATDHDAGRNRSRLRAEGASASLAEAREQSRAGAGDGKDRRENVVHCEPLAMGHQPSALSPQPCLMSALRRCRQPVPARVAVADGRPVRVTTDRRGFTGGAVKHCAGPWRTSGEWWVEQKLEVRREKLEVEVEVEVEGEVQSSDFKVRTSGAGGAGPWNRDEWDVALNDGAVYRVFRDRDADRWFIDAVVD
jgi:protein ImuB